MIDHLTHPKFVNYDPSVLPSAQGGGMGTKTYRALEAIKEVYPRSRVSYNDFEFLRELRSKYPKRFSVDANMKKLFERF